MAVLALLAALSLSSASPLGAVTMLSPPVVHTEPPPGRAVVEMPLERLMVACSLQGHMGKLETGEVLLGCSPEGDTEKGSIMLPTEASFPWDHACWLEVRAHEFGHAWGDFPADHKNYKRVFVCSPK